LTLLGMWAMSQEARDIFNEMIGVEE
jgi:hypothetical protein